MQITKPTFYKEFSCIAGACPDTCCAGWQIMIDEKSLQKYRRFKGSFRNRLHNDIDWKEHSFCQYDKRCAFLNEDNLCDIYSEAGKDMLCDTCRKYPRHIEEGSICTFMIHELAVGTWLKNGRHFTFEDMIFICYRFSRELEHSDPNLNEMERLMDEEDVFDFRNLLTI